LAVAIENEFGITAELKEGHGGIYEVTVDGNTVYTNREAPGQIPPDEKVLEEIRKRM